MEGNNGNNQQRQESAEVEKQINEVQDRVAARKAKVKKEIKEWLVALVVAVLIVVVIQSFLFRIIRVDGHSMDTTLANGERLFVTVADVKFGEVQRDSVVICHYPGRGMTYFVKRCVAVPGDTVYRTGNVTHVVYEQDGQLVDEALDDYVADGSFSYGSVGNDYKYTLGEDEYFVVGDNRYNSHDSRDWNDSDESRDVGAISKKMIVGRVREVIWPLSQIRSVN